MPPPPRKHHLGAQQRLILQLLADTPFGATEATMLVNGFKRRTLVRLIRGGLATAQNEISAGGHSKHCIGQKRNEESRSRNSVAAAAAEENAAPDRWRSWGQGNAKHLMLRRVVYILFLLAVLFGSFFLTLWLTEPQVPNAPDNRSPAERLAAYSWTTSVSIKSMESKKPLRLAVQFRSISQHTVPT
jgi:hypothetical protein